MSNRTGKKTGGAKKYGRNKEKCELYRRLIGKPRGPGVPGNKAGRNRAGTRKEQIR